MTMQPSDWVEAVAALATLGAVLVALFRERILAGVHPPQLVAELASSEGELVDPVALTVHGRQLRGAALYFHVHVRNPRRYFVVRSVEVALLKVEQRDDAGVYRAIWTGDFPLPWRHSPAKSVRVIGTPYDADLCFLTFGHGLVVEPSDPRPTHFPENFTGAVDLRLTVQARGEECDSPKLTLHVSWDGSYGAKPTDMQQHIRVTAPRPWYMKGAS